MTEEALRQHWTFRLGGLQQILQRAEDFKECEQCRAISPKHNGLCPYCRCYRFKEDVETVKATIRVMAGRPWPLNAGVVPRVNSNAAQVQAKTPAHSDPMRGVERIANLGGSPLPARSRLPP